MKNIGFHILAIAIVSIWGTTFVSTKVLLLNGLTPAEIFTIRFIIAYTLLRLFTLKQKMWSGNLIDELKLLGLGISGGSLYFLTENAALEYAPASNVSLLVCTTPILTILLVRLFYRSERLTGKIIAGSLIALAGVSMVVLNGHFVLELNPRGDLLAFSASLLWAIYTLLLRSLEGKYDNLFITRKVFGYGLLTIIPYLLLNPPSFNAPLTSAAVLGNIIYLGIVASLICYAAWNLTVKKIGTSSSSNYLYINPIAATITASLILGEQITIAALIGTALIFSGIYIARRK